MNTNPSNHSAPTPPALSPSQAVALARSIPSSGRLVVYLMMFLGLRFYETVAIKLADCTYSNGRLWLRVGRMPGRSQRSLPLPHFLSRAVERHVVQEHNITLTSVPPSHLHTPLITFGEASTARSMQRTWYRWFTAAVTTAGLDEAAIGYRLTTHHLRTSHLSYLLTAPQSHSGRAIATWLGYKQHDGPDPATNAPYAPAWNGNDDFLTIAKTIEHLAQASGIKQLP